MKFIWKLESGIFSRVAGAALAAGAIFALPVSGLAQTEDQDPPESPEKFEEQSLSLRTALHYDPSIQAPLQSLLALYRKHQRSDELLSIYRSHLLKYPDDASAQGVLIRLLRETRDPEAGQAARAAVKRFPKDDFLRYLYYEELEASRDPAALDELSKALSMATLPNRRRAWLDELVGKAVAEGRVDLTKEHFERLVAEQKDAPEALLQLSRTMHEASLYELALRTLEQAGSVRNVPPETAVDIEVLAARVEAALGKFSEAGERLDTLLTRVAPGYWRRSQIVVERVHLLKTDAARETMLTKARGRFEANPKSEAAALDFAEVLVASELRRDALDVLLKASQELPLSEEIERKTLELLDRLGDEGRARSYLDRRLEAFPERSDLRYRLVKALYLLSYPKEAAHNFDRLLADLKAEDQLKQRLDLARFLRRMNQPADAVPIFEAIIEANPERLDVLRELGEGYLAVGRRESARQLFVKALPKEAEIENFLDVVQFLVQQGMHLEAAAFLEKRLAADDGNFDLRLLLIDVLGKTGDQLRGETLIASTRSLSDTLARYNRWLETAAEFFGIFDASESFFDAEQQRLTDGRMEATPEGISRFLSFCGVAGRHQQQETIIAILRERLVDENLPGELRPRLRRLLVEALEKDPAHSVEVQEHLALLMSEDEGHADEYKLRRAGIHQSLSRPDLALPLIRDLKLDEIHDVALLAGSYQMFLHFNLMIEARLLVKRLTEIDPGTLSHWEKLLGMLAGVGDEEELRTSIRRLLAGLEKVQLSDESVTSLQLHLLDSYWRSIARLLASKGEERFADIFNYLNAIERQGAPGEDELWVLWTRAYLLNRLGQERARNEALETLELAARRSAGDTPRNETGAAETPASGGKAAREFVLPRIGFPDGISVSLEHALTLLREPPGAEAAEAIVAAEGPGADMQLTWVFESDPGTAIVQVETSGAGGVLVLDDQGSLYRIEEETGKLLWRLKRGNVFGTGYRPPNVIASRGASLQGGPLNTPPGWSGSPYQAAAGSLEPSQLRFAPRFAMGGGGRVVIPSGRELRCFSESDGALLWANFAGGDTRPFHPDQAGSVPPELSVQVDGERIYTFEPGSGIACGIGMDTGKLLWRRTLYDVSPATASSIMFGLNSGASYAAGNLFVYGERSAVIDCETGDVTWAFDDGDVRTFPLTLKAQSGESIDGIDNAKMPSAAIFSVSPSGSSAYGLTPTAWINHLSTSQARESLVPTFMKYKGALVSPALQWAQTQSEQMQASRGMLRGSRMLLMGPRGVELLSLDLPLAARSFPVAGTFAGFAGNKACIVKGSEVALLNLATGTTKQFRIGGLPENAEVEAAVSGPRIYLTNREGVYCVNAHTAKLLFKAPWPAKLDGEMTGEPDETATAVNGGPVYHWAGVAGSTMGKSGYCIPMRNRVKGRTLYAMVSSGKLAALRSGESASR